MSDKETYEIVQSMRENTPDHEAAKRFTIWKEEGAKQGAHFLIDPDAVASISYYGVRACRYGETRGKFETPMLIAATLARDIYDAAKITSNGVVKNIFQPTYLNACMVKSIWYEYDIYEMEPEDIKALLECVTDQCRQIQSVLIHAPEFWLKDSWKIIAQIQFEIVRQTYVGWGDEGESMPLLYIATNDGRTEVV